MNQPQKEYLTIKEFAELVGVSPQAIYKRLKQDDFLQYVQTDGKQKKISRQAIELYESKRATAAEVNADIAQLLQEQVNQLKQQIEKKDEEISSLHELLKNEQLLHAATRKQLDLLTDKQQETTSENVSNISNTIENEPQKEVIETPAETSSGGILKRLKWHLKHLVNQ